MQETVGCRSVSELESAPHHHTTSVDQDHCKVIVINCVWS